MKIAIIGATGFVGTALVNEFAHRGHRATAISRNPKDDAPHGITYVKADVFDTANLAEVLKGHDTVISAYNPGWDNPEIYDDYLKGARSIQQAVIKAGVDRFIVIGGAGSLYVSSDLQLVDTPKFPEEYKQGALAVRDYLNVLKKQKDLDWVFFSPAIEMHKGIATGRTGKYRLGFDSPVFDDQHRNTLSVEDLAFIIADETETPRFRRQRFTAGY
ncbi:NAD(P)-dependent oxidoreductase [Flavobacterium rhizosphaerae]|uniref:NAD(P)H-binding protein n=1 Tax=Flavobacterium rhizosphaerae TaxID=3163298 RepID=A0ABW8YTP9_9FLAO